MDNLIMIKLKLGKAFHCQFIKTRSMAEQIFIICLVSLVVYVGAAEHANRAINCITSDNFETCQERGLHFQENALFGGKCPGCVKMAEENDTCSHAMKCAPGLRCVKTKCIQDPAQLCFEARRQANKTGDAWMPECLPDGTYAPKQCKGEPMSGRCFCSSSDGKRIFGEEYWRNAENMTCACSRMMYDELQTRPSASLHCDDQGNFEGLQCDAGVCWCAHQYTATPYSIMVPLTMYKSLPCYSTSKHGNQYLRKCDSERVAQANAREILSIHGTNNIALSLVDCNYDGSYARVQIINNRKLCVDKMKMKLTEYEMDIGDFAMTCNCEYDQKVVGVNKNLICVQNGNYGVTQYAGTDPYCVDSDGYSTPCKQKKSRKGKNIE